MGMSPTKTGEMREDSFWLIQSSASSAFYDASEDCPVEPVTTVKVDYYQFKHAVEIQSYANIHGKIFHGRRINNEVELFEWNDGKETPGLRAALEAKGLTVRTYVPESATKASKFPKVTFKAVMGKDAEPRSELERCTDALKNSLIGLGKDFGTTIDFAILADADKQRVKTMLVCRMRPQEFYDLYHDGMEKVTWRHVTYQVLGAVDCGDVRLRCPDETFTAFFTPTKDLLYHVEVCFYDHVRQQEAKEREDAKVAKKRAKKHRRQMTLSTIGDPSEKSITSQSQDDEEEAIRSRQREKNKAKKKAQKERKKAKVREGELAQKLANDGDGEGDKDNRDQFIQVLGSCGSHLIIHNKDGPRVVKSANALSLAALLSIHRSRSTESVTKKATPDDDSFSTASNESSGTENSSGLQVIQAVTTEEIHREVQKVKGPVFMASPDENEVPEKPEDKAGMELRYLGRGL